jgi:hypothetical protein
MVIEVSKNKVEEGTKYVLVVGRDAFVAVAERIDGEFRFKSPLNLRYYPLSDVVALWIVVN